MVQQIETMKLSKSLTANIQGIIEDPEFLFDHKLPFGTKIQDVQKDKPLFLKCLEQVKENYNSDIEMEKMWGDDYEYLIPTLRETETLIKKLS